MQPIWCCQVLGLHQLTLSWMKPTAELMHPQFSDYKALLKKKSGYLDVKDKTDKNKEGGTERRKVNEGNY